MDTSAASTSLLTDPVSCVCRRTVWWTRASVVAMTTGGYTRRGSV